MGLLKVASNLSYKAQRVEKALGVAEQTIVKLVIKLTEEAKYDTAGEEVMWDYVEKTTAWWKGESAKVGVLTTIGDYTNKKGETYKAHFTENHQYLARLTDKNPHPYSYTGFFMISKSKFGYVMNMDAKVVSDFFQPNVESVEPLSAPPRKIMRPKMAKPVKAKWDDDE